MKTFIILLLKTLQIYLLVICDWFTFHFYYPKDFLETKSYWYFFDIDLDESNILKDRTLIMALIMALLHNVR